VGDALDVAFRSNPPGPARGRAAQPSPCDMFLAPSICSGVDANLNFLPLAWQSYKVPLDLGILAVLLVLDL